MVGRTPDVTDPRQQCRPTRRRQSPTRGPAQEMSSNQAGHQRLSSAPIPGARSRSLPEGAGPSVSQSRSEPELSSDRQTVAVPQSYRTSRVLARSFEGYATRPPVAAIQPSHDCCPGGCLLSLETQTLDGGNANARRGLRPRPGPRGPSRRSRDQLRSSLDRPAPPSAPRPRHG